MICWVVGMPAVHGDGVTGLFVVIGEDGRKLLEQYVGRKLVGAIVEPRFWIERVIIAVASRVVPIPGVEATAVGVGSGQDLGEGFGCALRLLEHGELIHIDGLIFVDTTFQVPAGKVTAVGAGKGPGTEAADGRSLPEAIIDDIERGLLRAGIG